ALNEVGWRLALIGGENVAELAAQIVAKLPATENKVGRLSLRDTARLLDDCDAFVGNDSGVTHLASLVALKCLVISGGGTFRRFRSEEHTSELQSRENLVCRLLLEKKKQNSMGAQRPGCHQ